MWKKLLHRSTDALPILHLPSPPLQSYPDHPPLCPAPTGRDQVMWWWAAMWSCLAFCFWDVALDKAARMLQTGHHGSGMRGWQSGAPLLSYSTNGWSQCGRSRGGVSRFSYYHLISRSRVPLWYHLSWTPYGGWTPCVGMATLGPSCESPDQQRAWDAELNHRIKLLFPLLHEVTRPFCLPHSLREAIQKNTISTWKDLPILLNELCDHFITH